MLWLQHNRVGHRKPGPYFKGTSMSSLNNVLARTSGTDGRSGLGVEGGGDPLYHDDRASFDSLESISKSCCPNTPSQQQKRLAKCKACVRNVTHVHVSQRCRSLSVPIRRVAACCSRGGAENQDTVPHAWCKASVHHPCF